MWHKYYSVRWTFLFMLDSLFYLSILSCHALFMLPQFPYIISYKCIVFISFFCMHVCLDYYTCFFKTYVLCSWAIKHKFYASTFWKHVYLDNYNDSIFQKKNYLVHMTKITLTLCLLDVHALLQSSYFDIVRKDTEMDCESALYLQFLFL